jgi:hypothetical protein
MFSKWVLAALPVMLILSPAYAAVKKFEQLNRTIAFDQISELELEIEIGEADLKIGQVAGDNLLEAKIDYLLSRGEPIIEYHRTGNVGRLHIISGDQGEEKDQHNRGLHEYDEKWELNFTTKIPLNIDLQMGMVDAEVNLSGMRVINLDLSGGLSDVEIAFNEPNKEEIDEIKIDVGLGDFNGIGLGNANFHRLNLNTGLGKADLDLSGVWKIARADVVLEVGLGRAIVVIPRKIGIEVSAEENFLSSIDLDRLIAKIDDGLYRTSNWNSAATRLNIQAEAGLGGIKIKLAD